MAVNAFPSTVITLPKGSAFIASIYLLATSWSVSTGTEGTSAKGSEEELIRAVSSSNFGGSWLILNPLVVPSGSSSITVGSLSPTSLYLVVLVLGGSHDHVCSLKFQSIP